MTVCATEEKTNKSQADECTHQRCIYFSVRGENEMENRQYKHVKGAAGNRKEQMVPEEYYLRIMKQLILTTKVSKHSC